MQNSIEFVSQRAERIGINLPLRDLLKWKKSWKDNLTAYAISLMDPSQPALRFHEVVMAPFITGRTNIFKATSLSVVLAAIWFMPAKYALHAIRRLLGIPQARDPSITTGTGTSE